MSKPVALITGVGDARRGIRFAQVVVLVLDADDMLEKQDLAIARQVIDEGRTLVIAANKWDAIRDKKAALGRLEDRLAGQPCVAEARTQSRPLTA